MRVIGFYMRNQLDYLEYQKLAGGLMNGLVILGLLIVDFYQIPYVFEGILPILINLGFILLPIFYWQPSFGGFI